MRFFVGKWCVTEAVFAFLIFRKTKPEIVRVSNFLNRSPFIFSFPKGF